MKKLFFITGVAIYSLIHISCTNEENFVYSCNEDLNNWAKENILEIQKMTRKEWKALEEEKKKPAYAAFTKQQRITFWEEKFKELKTLNWSEEEWKHIEKLQEFTKNHHEFFSGKKLTDDQSDELHAFCYSWCKEAMDRFGWSELSCAAIVASGEEVKSKNEPMSKGSNDPIIIDDPDRTPNCSCHAGNILFTTCFNGEVCEETDCIGSSPGCGFILWEDCNGLCIY